MISASEYPPAVFATASLGDVAGKPEPPIASSVFLDYFVGPRLVVTTSPPMFILGLKSTLGERLNIERTQEPSVPLVAEKQISVVVFHKALKMCLWRSQSLRLNSEVCIANCTSLKQNYSLD